MLPLPLPWLIVGVIVSLFGTYRVGHHYGWLERDSDMQIEIAKKNEEARVLEQTMTSKLTEQETKLRKAQDDIQKKQSAMHELARTGRLRLPTPSCPQATQSATVAAGNPQPEQPPSTESEQSLISALIDIAADGDKAITKLNACVSSYNEVRRLINGNE
jgi:hypothetical protein